MILRKNSLFSAAGTYMNKMLQVMRHFTDDVWLIERKILETDAFRLQTCRSVAILL